MTHKQKKSEKPAQKGDRDKSGKFQKGNVPRNKLDPEVKCIRAALKTEIARVTHLLTYTKADADKVLKAKDRTYLHEIMADALKKKKQYVIDSFIDRTIGKPTQATSVSLKQMPDDQLLEMLKEAMEEVDG